MESARSSPYTWSPMSRLTEQGGWLIGLLGQMGQPGLLGQMAYWRNMDLLGVFFTFFIFLLDSYAASWSIFAPKSFFKRFKDEREQ